PNQTGPDWLKSDQTVPDRPRLPKTGPETGFYRFKAGQTGSKRF
ncbi:hypothetical protein CPC698_1634, partial [Chlamydia psittaci C6/98]